MFGFFLGTVCLALLVGSIAKARWRRRMGYYGGGCGSRGWHGGHGRHFHGGPGAHFGGGWGSDAAGERGAWLTRQALRGVFERLQTTPGQERVILQAVEEMRTSMKGMRETWRHFQEESTRALTSPVVDETSLGESFAKQDEALRTAQKAYVGALAKVHEALEPDQRAQLARMMGAQGEGRVDFAGGPGPYRV